MSVCMCRGCTHLRLEVLCYAMNYAMYCKRIACVLELNSSATNLDLTKSVSTDCGWMKQIIDGRDMLAPQWDTLESNRKTDQLRMAILKKCGCAKSRCLTNRCSCRKNSMGDGGDGFCTSLCTCNDCANRKGEKEVPIEIDNDDESDESEDDDSEDECDGTRAVSDIGDMNDTDLQEMMDLMGDNEEEDDEENFVDYLLA